MLYYISGGYLQGERVLGFPSILRLDQLALCAFPNWLLGERLSKWLMDINPVSPPKAPTAYTYTVLISKQGNHFED